MADYIIDWQSNNLQGIPGKDPITLSEATTNNSSTSLTLTGANWPGYGEIQQENFIRLMETFASSNAPQNPTVGQIWYDYSVGQVKVFGMNEQWFLINSRISIGSSLPPGATVGDMFYLDTNDINEGIYHWDGNNWIRLGLDAPISAELIALSNISGLGYVFRTGGAAYATRQITGQIGEITVSNSNGVEGFTTIDLQPSGVVPGTYTSVVVNANGRIIDGGTANINNSNVSGPTTLNVTQSGTYIITDFDSFTTYIISPINGSVSRNGETITYTAPNVGGTGGFILNGRSIIIAINGATVLTPTISAPTNGSTNQSRKPTISATAFSVSGSAQIHSASQWQISTNPAFTVITDDSGISASSLTSWIPSTHLNASTIYYVRVRYQGNITGFSAWSSTVQFTTGAVNGILSFTHITDATAIRAFRSIGTGTGTTFTLWSQAVSGAENDNRETKDYITAHDSITGEFLDVVNPIPTAATVWKYFKLWDMIWDSSNTCLWVVGNCFGVDVNSDPDKSLGIIIKIPYSSESFNTGSASHWYYGQYSADSWVSFTSVQKDATHLFIGGEFDIPPGVNNQPGLGMIYKWAISTPSGTPTSGFSAYGVKITDGAWTGSSIPSTSESIVNGISKIGSDFYATFQYEGLTDSGTRRIVKFNSSMSVSWELRLTPSTITSTNATLREMTTDGVDLYVITARDGVEDQRWDIRGDTLIKISAAGNVLWSKSLVQSTTPWTDGRAFEDVIFTNGAIYTANQVGITTKWSTDGDPIWARRVGIAQSGAFGPSHAIAPTGLENSITSSYYSTVSGWAGDIHLIKYPGDSNAVQTGPIPSFTNVSVTHWAQSSSNAQTPVTWTQSLTNNPSSFFGLGIIPATTQPVLLTWSTVSDNANVIYSF